MKLFTALRRRVVAPLDPRLAPQFHDVFASDPVIIYDVGAAGGLFSPYAEGPSGWAPVIGFEPHAESFERLSGGTLPEHASVHRVALCDRDGDVSFNAGAGDARTRSSLLSIDVLGFETRTEIVAGARLDSVPDRLSIAPANFIKLDTEGSEAIILGNGADMLNANVLGVMCEVGFWRDTEGCVFSDIDRLLTGHGFVLFDLQINRSDLRVVGGRKDKVRSGDALYLRNFDTLPQAPDDRDGLRHLLLKLMSLAVAWRYLNYALELADRGRQLGLLDPAEFHAVVEQILPTVDLSDRVPGFPGKATLARLFDVLSYALQPNMKKGVPHAFNGLGNHWVVKRPGAPPDHVDIYCPVMAEGTTNRVKRINVARVPD